VELIANKINVLSEVNRNTGVVPEWVFGRVGRDHDFSSEKLPSELRTAPARLTTIGKLDNFRLLVYEQEGRTLLTLDLEISDSDGDGLSDQMEAIWGYDPLNPNTDGDSYLDGQEVPTPSYRVMTREDFLTLFRNQAQRPQIGSVVELRNGWILAFEEQSRSLVGFRADPKGGPGILANIVVNQQEIQNQLFPPPQAKSTVNIRQMVEFSPNQILVIPANPNLNSIYRFEVEEELDDDGDPVALGGEFVLRPFIGNQSDVDFSQEQFLEFSKIVEQTGNKTVDVRDFMPTVIPGTPDILLFDRSINTSSFILVTVRNDPFTEDLILAENPVIPGPEEAQLTYRHQCTVQAEAFLEDCLNANEQGCEARASDLMDDCVNTCDCIKITNITGRIEYTEGVDYSADVITDIQDPLFGLVTIIRIPSGSIPSGVTQILATYTDKVLRTSVQVTVNRLDLIMAMEEAREGEFDRQFQFTESFLHQDKPLILCFEDESNNLFAYDYEAGPFDPKIEVFTSATQLSQRIDLRFDPEFDDHSEPPTRLLFGTGNVFENKLAFDFDTSEVLSFNFVTGQVVVVLHRRDVTAVTGASLFNLNYMLTIDEPPQGKGRILRIVDDESTSLLGINLEYEAIPVVLPR